jgi:hypothetical protein
MDTFANKAWLVELIYRRVGSNGRRPASRFYISGWNRPSQVIDAVRAASGSSDDEIVFPLRELSQDENNRSQVDNATDEGTTKRR